MWSDRSDWQPMWRTLKTAELRKNAWVYLTWESEGRTPDGTTDCGYSGKALDIADDWAILVDR